jgi:formylglycine-generating enzyme required for sulfatase activity
VSRETPKLIGGGVKQEPHELRDLVGEPPVLLRLPGEPGRFRNSLGMKLVRIRPGTFKMGSPADEKDRAKNEQQHEVQISKPFYLGIHEVTQKQFRQVMGKNPSAFCASGEEKDKVKGMNTDDFPVDSVSWHDAVQFCRKLSALPAEKKARREYRLPTEAEWEYACRAGTRTPFAFGATLSPSQANFAKSRGRPMPVGSYKPNAWGLYDMHGNIWEWCHDIADMDYYARSPRKDPQGAAAGIARVQRGGAWLAPGRACRSAFRAWGWPNRRRSHVGFRVACQVLPGD